MNNNGTSNIRQGFVLFTLIVMTAFAAVSCLDPVGIPMGIKAAAELRGNQPFAVLDLNGAAADGYQLFLEPGSSGTVSRPERDPVRQGYGFGGWFADSDCSVPFDFSGTVITETVFIYAKWDEIRWTLSFLYNYNDGSEGEYGRQSVLNGYYAGWMTSPVRPGYGFGGWYTDPAGATAFTFDQVVTHDQNLYAKWDAQNRYVHYSMNHVGGEIGSRPYPAGQNLTPETLLTPVRTGYSFGGWYATSDCAGQPWPGGVMNEDKTLYAKWTPIVYTVTFKSHVMSNDTYVVQVEHGKTVAHISPDQLANPANAASNSVLTPSTGWTGWTGWGFIRWEGGGHEGGYDFTTPVTGNLSLIGLWVQNRYTVTLDGMNGLAPEAITNIPGGGQPWFFADNAPVPIRAGHTFEGWYTDTRYTTAYTPSPLYSDITLYAKWTAHIYDVTFNAEGGIPGETIIQVPHGGRAVPPVAPPTKTGGYNFAGWWTDAVGGSEVDFTSDAAIITSDTEFHARWTTLQTYSVLFNYNVTGITSVTRTVIAGQRVVPPAATPMRAGYSFMGWYTAASGGNPVDFATDAAAVISQGVTFFAQWKAVFTVTLVNPNTSAVVLHTVPAGQTLTLATPSGWAGQHGGWYNSAAIATAARLHDTTAQITVNQNITLYAKMYFSVTFDWTAIRTDGLYATRIIFKNPLSSSVLLYDSQPDLNGITGVVPTVLLNYPSDSRTIHVAPGTTVMLPNAETGAGGHGYVNWTSLRWRQNAGPSYAANTNPTFVVNANVTFTAIP